LHPYAVAVQASAIAILSAAMVAAVTLSVGG